MINFRVKIVFNHIPAVRRTLKNNETALARDFANAVRNNAKIKAPVLTGNLKLNIYVERAGKAYHVIADTQHTNKSARDYATYVEFGTRYTRAQPFLLPAFYGTKNSNFPLQALRFGRRVEIAARLGASN